MTAKKLVQLIIGAVGFVLETIWFDTEMNKVIFAVHTTRWEKCHCGICHRKAKRYDRGRVFHKYAIFGYGFLVCMDCIFYYVVILSGRAAAYQPPTECKKCYS